VWVVLGPDAVKSPWKQNNEHETWDAHGIVYQEYCFLPTKKWRQKVSLKHCQTSSRLQGITTQKTTFIIVMNIWVCKRLGITWSC